MEPADFRPGAWPTEPCSGRVSASFDCLSLRWTAGRLVWLQVILLLVAPGLLQIAAAEDVANPIRLVDASADAEAAVFAVKDELVMVRIGEPVADSGFSLFRVVRGGVLLSVEKAASKSTASRPLREAHRLLSLTFGGSLDKNAGALLAAGTEDPPAQIEISEFSIVPGDDDE